jgi:tetratricopeptide (TPR) repeat protein
MDSTAAPRLACPPGAHYSPPHAHNPATSVTDPARAARFAEALALHRRGALAEARAGYERLLAADPGDADALYYLALIAHQQGRLDDCLTLGARALARAPQAARVPHLMGTALVRAGRPAEALPHFDRAIALQADFAAAHSGRAGALADLGRRDEALAAYDAALKLNPDAADDWCNRGNVLADLGRRDDALQSLERAIALDADDPQFHFNRGNVLNDMGRLDDALTSFDRALALDPQMDAALTNSGLVLRDLGRLDEALSRLSRVAALHPDRPESFTHRANTLRQAGRRDEAAADYRRALALDPQSANAHVGLALIELTEGRWAEGFRHYEYREMLASPPFASLPFPRWRGEPLPGARLVLLAEQGLGDTLQFCRFAPLIASRGFEVTLLVRPGLAPLLSTLKDVTIASSVAAIARDPRPTHWLPLMSAPGLLGVTPASVPADVPYLTAEPQRTARWAAQVGDGFTIGINWASGPSREWYLKKRDIPLAAFAPLAGLPNVRLVSLQKGSAAAEIARVPFGAGIVTPDTDPDPERDLFGDTAALMSRLDLIVTCDTSVAHLAGALGRPAFTALPQVADWRWGANGETTPWYPPMRLFRQDLQGDWGGVFARIAQAVRALL